MKKEVHSVRDERLRRGMETLSDDNCYELFTAILRTEQSPVSYEDLETELPSLEAHELTEALQKLTGTVLVEKDDGYKIPGGWKHGYRTLVGLTEPTESSGRFPAELGQPCSECGSPLEITYVDHFLSIVCPDCGSTFYQLEAPPAGVQTRTIDELRRALDERIRATSKLVARGICPWCTADMDVSIKFEESSAFPHDVWAEHFCRRCGGHRETTIAINFMGHPAVVSFLYENGVNQWKTYCWEREYWTADVVSIESRDPVRLAVVFDRSDGRLTLTVDDRLSVLDASRSDL